MEDEIGLEQLLDIIIRDKGGSKDDYNKLMDYIAYHETGPVDSSVPDQRMNPAAQQYIYDEKLKKYVPSGTGKGLFMFESHIEYDKEGKPLSTGGNMASNYLAQILEDEGIDKPQWLTNIWAGKKKVDASKLTADQQKMLFLAYHRQHPKSHFSELWEGTLTKPQWWGKYHWAGDEDELAGKEGLFEKSMLSKDIYDAEQKKIKAAEEKKLQQLEIKKNSAPFLSNPDRGVEKKETSFWDEWFSGSAILDKYDE